MFKIGDTVVYGTEGVCKITDISKSDFSNMDTDRLYYILTPQSHKGSKIYVPCDNEILVSRMRDVMKKSEIVKLLKDRTISPEWNADSRQRNKEFKEIIASYDREKMFGLARLLCEIKKSSDSVRRMYASDEEIFKKLLTIIYTELSLVSEISQDEIPAILLGELPY